ncbi:MAG: hypothetical protein P1R58_13460, partial [bacterium]|nr:hypothetical protein [bacterium]
MSGNRINIVGTGLFTPLGTDSDQTAASIAAGLSAFEESPIMDRAFQPFILGSLPQDCLPELHASLAETPGLTYRETRLIRLAAPAIQETLSRFTPGQSPPPLFLGLPERSTNIKLDPDKFLQSLHTQTESCFDLSGSHALVQGRSSGLTSVHLACAAIKSGKTKIAIAGG